MRKRWLILGVVLPVAAVWLVWQIHYDGADPRAIFRPAQPPCSTSPAALDEIVSLHVDEQPLQQALAEIEDRYGVAIEIDDAALADIGVTSGAKVTFDADSVEPFLGGGFM